MPDQVRARIRIKHYSCRTGQTCLDWITRQSNTLTSATPRELSAAHVERHLSYLTTEREVAASTQNQAKSALLFFYKAALGTELPRLDEITQAKASKRLPVWLTQVEVAQS